MDKKYVSSMLCVPQVEMPYGQGCIPVGLPDGCVGILYVWKTKTAARKYYSKKVGLREITLPEKGK